MIDNHWLWLRRKHFPDWKKLAVMIKGAVKPLSEAILPNRNRKMDINFASPLALFLMPMFMRGIMRRQGDSRVILRGTTLSSPILVFPG